jgi:cytidine kinase
MTGEPEFIAVGAVIIDDIVFPDGHTQMGVLGGGVIHAAAGMSIWGQRAGLVTCTGHDLPDDVLRRLEREYDLRGLLRLDQPQARAWQVFEWDGKRTEVFRTAITDEFLYGPPLNDIPPAYRRAKGVHLLRAAGDLAAWRAAFPAATLLWEPLQVYMVADNRDEFRAGLAHVDIVSPNLVEAQQMYGIQAPDALVPAMLDDGAPLVALRMGAQGSLVGQQGRDDLLRVPAVPVASVVDQTGAGNTYCGAFLVGWVATGDLARAACYAAVAASFALEATGVADPPDDFTAERDARYQRLHRSLAD